MRGVGRGGSHLGRLGRRCHLGGVGRRCHLGRRTGRCETGIFGGLRRTARDRVTRVRRHFDRCCRTQFRGNGIKVEPLTDEHHPQRSVGCGHLLQDRSAGHCRSGGSDRHRRQRRRGFVVFADHRQRHRVVIGQQQRRVRAGTARQRCGGLGLGHHLDVLHARSRDGLPQGVGGRKVGQAQARRGDPVARFGHLAIGADDGVGQFGQPVVGQVEGVLVQHLTATRRRPDHRQSRHPSGDRHPEDYVHGSSPCLTHVFRVVTALVRRASIASPTHRALRVFDASKLPHSFVAPR